MELGSQTKFVVFFSAADGTPKSFDGLAALVRDWLGGDPLSGHIFVFRNKAADRVKLLVWEEDGYAIWYKKHE
jgi:transposase